MHKNAHAFTHTPYRSYTYHVHTGSVGRKGMRSKTSKFPEPEEEDSEGYTRQQCEILGRPFYPNEKAAAYPRYYIHIYTYIYLYTYRYI